MDKITTEEERKRIDDIVRQCTATPPMRIYSDDAMFLLGVIQRLVRLIMDKGFDK